eukprot:6065686-Prymnesium_polylepis.1
MRRDWGFRVQGSRVASATISTCSRLRKRKESMPIAMQASHPKGPMSVNGLKKARETHGGREDGREGGRE